MNCCNDELRKTDKWMSGHNQDGDVWTCPACEKSWIYVEDEAEGGSWHRGQYGGPQ